MLHVRIIKEHVTRPRIIELQIANFFGFLEQPTPCIDSFGAGLLKNDTAAIRALQLPLNLPRDDGLSADRIVGSV